MKRKHLIVSGFVQGVGFRFYARHEALASKLTGFVRNLPDGSVEIEAQGTEEQLKRLVKWAKHGPQNAIVESCRQSDVEVVEGESDFIIR
jgi:acylphosphatase